MRQYCYKSIGHCIVQTEEKGGDHLSKKHSVPTVATLALIDYQQEKYYTQYDTIQYSVTLHCPILCSYAHVIYSTPSFPPLPLLISPLLSYPIVSSPHCLLLSLSALCRVSHLRSITHVVCTSPSLFKGENPIPYNSGSSPTYVIL